MKEINLDRSDFRKSQDYPNDSLFDDIVLEALGFKKEEREKIDQITLTIFKSNPSPDES